MTRLDKLAGEIIEAVRTSPPQGPADRQLHKEVRGKIEKWLKRELRKNAVVTVVRNAKPGSVR